MADKGWIEELKEQISSINIAEEQQKWNSQMIYKVPTRLRDANPKMYEPVMVSIGPHHHGKPNLNPMEHHKRRALVQFVERSKKPIEEFGAALESVADKLMDAYEGLDDQWRDKNHFLQLMLADGCFLVELLRGLTPDFQPLDPIFSVHGVLSTFHYLVPDILMLENQIPLLALAKLVAVERDISEREAEFAANTLALKVFFNASATFPEMPLGLHFLDVFHQVFTFDIWPAHIPINPNPNIATKTVRSATELVEAGIVIKKSQTISVKDISFENGVLTIPALAIEKGGDVIFYNCVAFERLRPGAGHDIRTYMLFMSGLVSTARDAALIKSLGLLQFTIGSDEDVVELLKGLSKDVFFDPRSRISDVQDRLNVCYEEKVKSLVRRFRNWRENVTVNHSSNPWNSITVLVSALFAIAFSMVQAYYASRRGKVMFITVLSILMFLQLGICYGPNKYRLICYESS